jgi:hypothetical protein
MLPGAPPFAEADAVTKARKVAVRLAASDLIPALITAPPSPVAKILALRDLVAVGSTPAGQRLEFAPKGLTVVYGENGSGKSSYARVLRKSLSGERKTGRDSSQRPEVGIRRKSAACGYGADRRLEGRQRRGYSARGE